MNTRWRLRLVGLVIPGAFLLGCPDGGGGSTGTGSSSVCGGYFDALLARSTRCGASDLSPARVEAYRGRFATVCANAAAAPGASSFESWLASCTTTIANGACGADVDCQAPSGDLADGTACAEDFQCQSGYCAVENRDGTLTGGASCGACAPRAPIGQPCTSDNGCANGARCVEGSDDVRRCTASETLPEGANCRDATKPGAACATDMVCRTGEDGVARCARPGAVGATCSTRYDCATDLACVDRKCGTRAEGDPCQSLGGCGDRNLACSAATSTCVKRVFVGIGQECNSSELACETGLCKGQKSGLVDGKVTVTPGKCVAYLADGAACTPSTGTDQPSCDVFASCVDGKCTVVAPAACK